MTRQDETRLHAYNRMMERVRGRLRNTEHKTVAALHAAIDDAKATAVELGELTRDEAELLGAYLRRDLEDAGDYLAKTGTELGGWLQFDIALIESGLREMFIEAADQTKLALLELAERAREASIYRTGEITGVGTLRCSGCGTLLHFHATTHIPPCPKCHGTVFDRAEDGR